MPESSALVTAVLAGVVTPVVAAMIPSVRRLVVALVRLCVRRGRNLCSKIRRRGENTSTVHPSKQEPTGEAASPRAVSVAEQGRRFPAAVPASGTGAGVITVHRGDRPLAGAQALVLFPNKTWVHSLADSEGVASVDLHSLQLPMTVFVAAEGCAAHVETGWIAGEGALTIDLSPLPDGGSMVITQGTGHIPGLAGRLNPIRDRSDRTYLYADNIAINGGKPQPVSFVPGDEQLQLADANGNEFLVRVAAITGPSSLLEYSRCPAPQHSVDQEDTDMRVSLSLSTRVAEGAREEAETQRRTVQAWILSLVRGALDDPNPLARGRLGGPRSLGEVSIGVELPAQIHERAQRVAAEDDRTLENWIEALVEKTVRDAEPLIVGGGPSYYDGGRKYPR